MDHPGYLFSDVNPPPADRDAAMFASDELRPATSGRKPLGKLASRLEEVKNPWRQVSTLELSHNEAARLATDALLEHGENEYRRVLVQEREVNFLSQPEIQYITQHVASKACGSGSNGFTERDIEDGDAVSELTSGTYFPMMSDEEPPLLELGWPGAPVRYAPSETKIYFQRDKSHNIKDIIRSLINQAKKVRGHTAGPASAGRGPQHHLVPLFRTVIFHSDCGEPQTGPNFSQSLRNALDL